jgi:hypothetical protein
LELAFVFSSEEFFASRNARFDGSFSFFPVGWADFAVGFEVLEGLDHSEGFIDGASERQVIDDLVSDNACFVDEEQAAEGDCIVEQNIVIPGDLLFDVSDKGVVYSADATFGARDVSPSEVGEFAVDRNADDFDAQVIEFFDSVGESDNFGWANEGKVQRVEEQQDVLSLELAEGQRTERSVFHNSIGGEIWSGFGDENCHGVETPGGSVVVEDSKCRKLNEYSGHNRPHCLRCVKSQLGESWLDIGGFAGELSDGEGGCDSGVILAKLIAQRELRELVGGFRVK